MTNTKEHIHDSEFGNIPVRRNPRARRLIFRANGEWLTITCPPHTPASALLMAVEKLRQRLRALLKRQTEQAAEPVTPEQERALAATARQTLPPRLQELARTHGLHYNKARIRNMHTRWGSCGAHGNISLSAYVMTLPTHLQEFVMLHELCHTIHMNHGPEFWAELDRLTGGNCAILRSEMKNHTIPPAARHRQARRHPRT